MADVPAHRCAVAWCRAEHRPGDKPGHAAELRGWQLDAVTLKVFVGQVDPHPPVVRIVRYYEGAARQVRDIAPELAGELADILDLIDEQARQEFVATLRQAAALLAEAEHDDAPPSGWQRGVRSAPMRRWRDA